MKSIRIFIFGLCVVAAAAGWSQQTSLFLPMGSAPQAAGLPQTTRYFQLTMVLKYVASSPDAEPGEQSITTEVAVAPNRAGSCKTRMTSQVPVPAGAPSANVAKDGTKFIELGTKIDCNNVHLDGDGLAFSMVLETSRVTGMIATGAKNQEGIATAEPIISQRNLELAVRLPLDKPKVIFDSKSKTLKQLKPLPNEVPLRVSPSMEEPAMQIEMVATELK